jgi:hypothetical protein
MCQVTISRGGSRSDSTANNITTTLYQKDAMENLTPFRQQISIFYIDNTIPIRFDLT